LHQKVQIFEGIDSARGALVALFNGKSNGKIMVKF